jgi:DNA (cytosine-5)-methyltransferase 1
MLRVAREAKAHTIVAENVTNLLRMRNGREFSASLSAIADFGFAYIAWRVLNTREFGLPQNRSRLLIIASQDPAIASTLFRKVPPLPKSAISPKTRDRAAGFYWTAGTHSINYSRGYVPTIKIGSSLGIASPPAVHYESVVRTLSPSESLRLQGFDVPIEFFSSPSSAYKAAGNAVARPIGRWVLEGLLELEHADTPKWAPTQDELFSDKSGQAKYPSAGFWADGVVTEVRMERHSVASNLVDFLDLSSPDRLSARASRGLLDRLARSGQPCPPDLRSLLEHLAA